MLAEKPLYAFLKVVIMTKSINTEMFLVNSGISLAKKSLGQSLKNKQRRNLGWTLLNLKDSKVTNVETHLPHRISVRTDGTTNRSHCLQCEEKERNIPSCINPISSPAVQEKPLGAPSEKQEAKLGVNRSLGVTQLDKR